MAKIDEYAPSVETVREKIKEYADSKGLKINTESIISELFSAKIFIKKEDEYLAFRYRVVLEYFIALRMIIDRQFRDWVLEEERYLSFTNEIQFYAGKLRNDVELIELISARHENILKAEFPLDFLNSDLNQIGSISLPKDNESVAVDAMANEINTAPLSHEDKDAELDLNIPKDFEGRQTVSRRQINQDEESFMSSLFLYSGLVKNMELISDLDKRKHLASVLHGWALIFASSLRFAPKLARDRKVRINGALYEVHAPHGMSDSKLLRLMMLHLPHVHARMLSASLGTEKLERQLTERSLSEKDESKIIDFFRTSLIMQLKFSSTPGAIRKLASELKNNKYLLWSLIVHISGLRRLNMFKEEHFRQLEDTLASAFANLKGGSHKDKQDEKRDQLKRLEQERIMLKIRKKRRITLLSYILFMS